MFWIEPFSRDVMKRLIFLEAYIHENIQDVVTRLKFWYNY